MNVLILPYAICALCGKPLQCAGGEENPFEVGRMIPMTCKTSGCDQQGQRALLKIVSTLVEESKQSKEIK